MNAVFADTFYFLALLNPKDAAHKRAVSAALTLDGKLVTTAWILTELGDALCAPVNRSLFMATLVDLERNPQVEILDADFVLFDAGVQRFAERPDKNWSLTDCISFTAMEARGITDALTADHHYEQAGFVALLK
jgi:predicted nucleic acid-binding protein